MEIASHTYTYLLHYLILISLIFTSVVESGSGTGEDFYELLGVDRGADTKTIRKAFKRIAILRHPDKNPDDPDAHSAFVRINRAYEVLKDEELRKKYDEHGEAGLEADFQSGHSHEYQSWQFYRDNFGIYDDDPEIVTLSRSDFAEEVHESEDLWFINFYSTFCSHCHALAPTWREFARQMDGIIRIGAVNCAEDPMLCQSQHVMGYPSLVAYPKHAFYHGHRDVDSLAEFITSHITTPIHRVKGRLDVSLPSTKLKPWVVEFCKEGEDYCLSEMDRRKVASLLKDIANFGTTDCSQHPKVCSDTYGRSEGLLYFSSREADSKQGGVEITYTDLKEIYSEVLRLIPPVKAVKELELRKLVSLDIDREEDTSPIYTFDSLLIFLEKITEGDPELAEYKKLEATFPEINVRLVDCSQPELKRYCGQMNLKSLPKAVLFRAGGVGYDINYLNQPKLTVRDAIKFLRKSLPSSLVTLTDESYVEAFNSDGTKDMWLIDYFAPVSDAATCVVNAGKVIGGRVQWCPPCLKLLTELRTLPRRVEGVEKELRVGTLDCQAHKEICEGVGVGSYPTTILYLNGVPHRSVGFHSANDVVEFIEEAINPSVQELTHDSFQHLVANREPGQVFIVDFYAPWCGPCQQLAPEFKKLARQMKQDMNTNSTVHFGSVDCDAERALCQENGVRSYPLVRLYPHQTELRTRDYPSNWWRDHKSMRQWLTEFLPSLVERVGGEFSSQVLGSLDPIVVDFFAPWCGHCVHFAPVFEQAAKVLEGKVRLVKVDCERTPYICQLAAVQAYPSVRLYTGVTREGERQSPTGIYINPEPNVDRLVSTIGGLLDRHPPPVWQETGRRWNDEL